MQFNIPKTLFEYAQGSHDRAGVACIIGDCDGFDSIPRALDPPKIKSTLKALLRIEMERAEGIPAEYVALAKLYFACNDDYQIQSIARTHTLAFRASRDSRLEKAMSIFKQPQEDSK